MDATEEPSESSKITLSTNVPPIGYARFLLWLLSLVYVLNFVDRQLLSILMPAIKPRLQLSDTALGLLSGPAFAIVYTVLGIPFARLADRVTRRGVIAICLALWSCMTALCGLAQSFPQLFIARMGVGVGEAGCTPPSHSLISDYYPASRRATALGIYALGVPVGTLIAFLAGGWLNQLYGWRVAFMAVGLPGVFLALIVHLAVRESRPSAHHAETSEPDSVWIVIELLWKHRSFRHLSLGAGVYTFAAYAIVQWAPSFLSRSHHMKSGEIGTWLAVVFGGGGMIGALFGGKIADVWGRRDQRSYAWLCALCMAVASFFAAATFIAQSRGPVLLCLLIAFTLGTAYYGPTFSATQALAVPRMRATAAAFLISIINIIGLGLGPAMVGMASDCLEPYFGEDSLRYSLLIASTAYPWSAYHFWRAGTTLRSDMETVARSGTTTPTHPLP